MYEPTSSVRPDLWSEYAALQKKADRVKLDPYAWAIEDQANHFLDSITTSLPQNAEARTLQLENLLHNRIKKHGRRRRLLDEDRCSGRTGEVSPEEIVVHQIDLSNRIKSIRNGVSDEEWRILCCLALGQDYVAVAAAERISVLALKSKVWRCRRRLRGV